MIIKKLAEMEYESVLKVRKAFYEQNQMTPNVIFIKPRYLKRLLKYYPDCFDLQYERKWNLLLGMFFVVSKKGPDFTIGYMPEEKMKELGIGE